MLKHIPDLTDFLLSVRILGDSLYQISAVSSVAVCQLLQCLGKAHMRIVKYPEEYKQQNPHSDTKLNDTVCVYLAAAFILSSGLPGLCLLEEYVLLLSPFHGGRCCYQSYSCPCLTSYVQANTSAVLLNQYIGM